MKEKRVETLNWLLYGVGKGKHLDTHLQLKLTSHFVRSHLSLYTV